jgi:hypothetical protein
VTEPVTAAEPGLGGGGLAGGAPGRARVPHRIAVGFDVVVCALSAALAISLVVAGWLDVSQGYDIWYYHLPFAARIVGIIDPTSYAFSADNAARYAGFPLLGEALQGLVWRLTGHIEATSFVSLGALLGLVVFLRRLFAVPLHLAGIALLAIPLVHIHVTSSYVDLPANAAVTMLLLCVHRALVAREVSPRLLAGAGALAAIAANIKFQLVPIVGLAAAVLVVVAFLPLRRWRTAEDAVKARTRRSVLVVLAAFPLVVATPLKNAIVHHNPVWPVELTVLGHSLPHVQEAYASSPHHLASAPGPVRFLRSALEIDNHPIGTHRRWSLDQWAPNDDPAARMGGYFGAYVVANLGALGWYAWRRRTREGWVGAGLFAGVTIVASLVPQSHELRYYMHWMLLLVSLNLTLWTTGSREVRAIAGLVAVIAFGVVAWSTDAGFLYPSGSTFSQYLAKRVEARVIEEAAPGERLCIAREPFTFLYAPAFHPSKRYAVQEATSDADCQGARRIE